MENNDKIRDCQAMSARFAQDASELSERIQTFERWLGSLDGKLPVGVAYLQDKLRRRLSYERHQGEWGLWLWRRSVAANLTPVDRIVGDWTGRRIRDASVDDKIAVVPVCRAILEKLHEEQAARLDRLHAASQALDDLATEILGGSPKEGE